MASYKSSLDIKINYNYWNMCCVKLKELCPMWGEAQAKAQVRIRLRPYVPAGIKSLSE